EIGDSADADVGANRRVCLQPRCRLTLHSAARIMPSRVVPPTIPNTLLPMIKIGINGFGRIGRLVFRAICDQGLLGKEIDVVAVNDIVPADNLAYLVKYDSTQGRAKEKVSSAKSSPSVEEDDLLIVDNHKIKCLAVREGPAALPWKELGVDIVVESTGLFTD